MLNLRKIVLPDMARTRLRLCHRRRDFVVVACFRRCRHRVVVVVNIVTMRRHRPSSRLPPLPFLTRHL